VLAVLGTFISLFISSFDYRSFPAFLLLYLSCPESLDSVILLVLSLTSSHFGRSLLPRVLCLYSSRPLKLVECTSLLLYAPSLYACSLPATRASELELNRSGRHGCTTRLLLGRCVMRLYDRARVDTSMTSGSSVRGRPLWGLRPLQGQCREWGSMWGRHSLHPWSSGHVSSPFCESDVARCGI